MSSPEENQLLFVFPSEYRTFKLCLKRYIQVFRQIILTQYYTQKYCIMIMAFLNKKKILYFCISLLDNLNIFYYTFMKLLITEKVKLNFLPTINWPVRGH